MALCSYCQMIHFISIRRHEDNRLYSQLCYHMTILRAAENACAVPDGAITDHRAYGEHGLRAQPWKMFSVTHL